MTKVLGTKCDGDWFRGIQIRFKQDFAEKA